MTYQEAKDQIAREVGYHRWLGLLLVESQRDIDNFEQLAADLYAQEAIKADRGKEPSEEEIEEAAWICMNADAEYSAPLTWIKAIEWYKSQINRSNS